MPQHLNKRGFSLIETAIVLAIVGLVIGGIWVAAANINSQRRYDLAANGIIQLADEYRNIYAGFRDDAIPAGEVVVSHTQFTKTPEGYSRKSNGNIVDPWGNQLYIDTLKSSGSSKLQILMNYQSKDACINLMKRVSLAPAIKQFNYDVTYVVAPVTLSQAETICTTRTGTTTGYIFWIF